VKKIPVREYLSVETSLELWRSDEDRGWKCCEVAVVRRERVCFHGGRREDFRVYDPCFRPRLRDRSRFLPIVASLRDAVEKTSGMKKSRALIEMDENGYSIFSADIKSTIIGVGDTLAEAKADFENSVREIKQFCAEDGIVDHELEGLEFEYEYYLG
jgi:predicted RNase H-like HicB family nuclease